MNLRDTIDGLHGARDCGQDCHYGEGFRDCRLLAADLAAAHLARLTQLLARFDRLAEEFKGESDEGFEPSEYVQGRNAASAEVYRDAATRLRAIIDGEG